MGEEANTVIESHGWPQGPHPSARIVVLSYGAGPAPECVRGIIESGCPPDRILVVHNRAHSDDAATGFPPGIAVVDTGGNLGYAGGMNVGVRAWRSSGLPIVLVTHDVTITYSDILVLAQHVSSMPGVALAAPRLVGPNGVGLSCGGMLDKWGNVAHIRRAVSSTAYSVDWVDGAVVALSTSAPEIPERYFLYYEDVAYSSLVRRAGGTVVVVPSATAVTTPGAASRSEVFRYFYWRNRLAFSLSDLGVLSTLYGVGRLCAAAALRTSALCRQGRYGAARKTLWLYGSAASHAIRGRLGQPPNDLWAKAADIGSE